MAGAYHELIAGNDLTFTTNISARVTELGANIVGASWVFVAQEFDVTGTGTNIISLSNANIANGVVSVNTTTKVASITVRRVATAAFAAYPLLWWELVGTCTDNTVVAFDAGKMAIATTPGMAAGTGA